MTLKGLAALASLPGDFSTAVELHDLEGFHYREVAEILDIPIGTVMSRIARGRRLLAARLVVERVQDGGVSQSRRFS